MKRDFNGDFSRFKNKDGNLTTILVEDPKTGEHTAVELGDIQVLKRTLKGLSDGAVGGALSALVDLHAMVDAAGEALQNELLMRGWQAAQKDPARQAELLQTIARIPKEAKAKLEEQIRGWQGELALREKEAVEGPQEVLLGPAGDGQFVLPGDERVH